MADKGDMAIGRGISAGRTTEKNRRLFHSPLMNGDLGQFRKRLRIAGLFFGPAAEELGAVWTLSDGTRTAIGTIGAKTGP